MCKLTFKQTLCQVNEEHCITSICGKNSIMSETEHIADVFIRYSVNLIYSETATLVIRSPRYYGLFLAAWQKAPYIFL